MEGKKKEILDGIVQGSCLVHGATSTIRSHLFKGAESSYGGKIEPKKQTKLEKIVEGATALVEVALYGLAAKFGIDAYYFALVTNAIDLVGLGTYFKLGIMAQIDKTYSGGGQPIYPPWWP